MLARFREIHSQVYRVYSVGLDRDAVHDQLAAAFAGDALTREYVEHWTTLARMRDEGTAIDVLSVDYESVAVAGSVPDGVLVEADWSVGGIVTHQSHKHHRINRYQAVYTMAMASTDGEAPALHIVDTRVRNAERVSTPLESPGGGSFPLDELPKSERGYLGPAELLRSGILDQGAPAGAQTPGAAATPPGCGRDRSNRATPAQDAPRLTDPRDRDQGPALLLPGSARRRATRSSSSSTTGGSSAARAWRSMVRPVAASRRCSTSWPACCARTRDRSWSKART